MSLASAPCRVLTTLGLVLLALAASLATANQPAPHSDQCKMVRREEWGARAPRRVTRRSDPVSAFLMVHHGGIANYSTDAEGSAAIVRSYQDLHMDVRGWDDVGYSFLVGEDGNVYEGRGWDRVGAHAPQYNDISIGVCFLGDFSDRLPNEAALGALRRLVGCSVAGGHLLANYTLLGHRQARSTLCPGEALYKEITTWPHWRDNPSPRMHLQPPPSTAAAGRDSVLRATLLAVILTLANCFLVL